MSVPMSVNVGTDQEPITHKSLPMSHDLVRTSSGGSKMSVATSYDMGTMPGRLGKKSVAI
eukprot:850818-Karenia_brevis.AAC.1